MNNSRTIEERVALSLATDKLLTDYSVGIRPSNSEVLSLLREAILENDQVKRERVDALILREIKSGATRLEAKIDGVE
ncbi:MAG TPA: hypothetical protein V6C76_12675 [Drouetiella sp.]